MKKFIVLLGILALAPGTLYAAPIDVPTALKVGYGQNVAAEKINPWNDWSGPIKWSVGAGGDMVAERELDLNEGEAQAMFYSGKFTFPLYLLGQWDWYADVGMAVNPEVKARVNGADVNYELDNGFSWGAGTNYIFYNNPETGWGVFTDIKYRAIEDTGYDEVSVNGTAFSSFSAATDARWDEWQIALGVTKRWDHWMIYGGPKVTETAIDADVTVGGTRYAFNNARTDMMVGGFAGLSYQFNENVSVDLEGRMGDEMGYAGKVVLKF